MTTSAYRASLPPGPVEAARGTPPPSSVRRFRLDDGSAAALPNRGRTTITVSIPTLRTRLLETTAKGRRRPGPSLQTHGPETPTRPCWHDTRSGCRALEERPLHTGAEGHLVLEPLQDVGQHRAAFASPLPHVQQGEPRPFAADTCPRDRRRRLGRNAGAVADPSGSASAVPIWRSVHSVRAAAACPPSMPASPSSATLNGVADPGTIRASAFPASCASRR